MTESPVKVDNLNKQASIDERHVSHVRRSRVVLFWLALVALKASHEAQNCFWDSVDQKNDDGHKGSHNFGNRKLRKPAWAMLNTVTELKCKRSCRIFTQRKGIKEGLLTVTIHVPKLISLGLCNVR